MVATCRRILEEIAEAEREASGEYLAPQGQLIVTTPSVFGRTPSATDCRGIFCVPFRISGWRLLLTDRYVNLIEEHVDPRGAYRGAGRQQHDRKHELVLIRLVLCASPALFEEARHAKNSLRILRRMTV